MSDSGPGPQDVDPIWLLDGHAVSLMDIVGAIGELAEEHKGQRRRLDMLVSLVNGEIPDAPPQDGEGGP